MKVSIIIIFASLRGVAGWTSAFRPAHGKASKFSDPWPYESDSATDRAIAAMDDVDYQNCFATDECTTFYGEATVKEIEARGFYDKAYKEMYPYADVTYFDAEGDWTVSCNDAMLLNVVDSCELHDGVGM